MSLVCKWGIQMRFEIDGVKIGEDYAVFQSAKHTSKTLKKIQKLWKSL